MARVSTLDIASTGSGEKFRFNAGGIANVATRRSPITKMDAAIIQQKHSVTKRKFATHEKNFFKANSCTGFSVKQKNISKRWWSAISVF